MHSIWITWLLSSPWCFSELLWRAGNQSSLDIPLKCLLRPLHMLQVTQGGPCWHHQHSRLQSGAGTASSSSIPHSNRPCQRLYKAFTGTCSGLGLFWLFHLGSCLYLLLSDQLCLLHFHYKNPAFSAF